MAEKTINGRKFIVEKMRAMKTMKRGWKILGFFSIGVAELKTMFGDDSERKKNESPKDYFQRVALETGVLFNALEAMLGRDEDEFEELITTILDGEFVKIIRADGDPSSIDIDGDFSYEHMQDILPLAVFVLQVQYGDFINGLSKQKASGETKKS